MNLTNDKNFLLAKKAVYAEQLFYYSKLCKVYQDLANYAQKSPKDMEITYAEPLSRILSSKDLEKTLYELEHERNDDLENHIIGKKYSPKEISYFQKYAEVANIFKTFQTASTYLDNVGEAQDASDKDAALTDFHKYMQNQNRPKVVQNFDTFIQNNPSRYIGARFFLLANKSINTIKEIDPSHIPFDSIILKHNITPKSFGANIHGYKTIVNQIENIEQSQGSTHTRNFSPDNWDLYNVSEKKVQQANDEFNTLSSSIGRKTYYAGSKVKNAVSPIYKANKGTLKKAALVAAAVATIVGGAHQVSKEFQANSLNINSSTQYEQTISNETEAYINSIIENLNLQKNAFDPQYEDVREVEKNIDLVLDYIVKDQVTTAFEAYHEGYTVTDVESWFDQSLSGTANHPQNYQFIDVSYIDDKGNPGKESISEFRSEFITQNHLKDIFKLEEAIDYESPVWNAFNDDGTRNFLEKAQSVDEVMQYLSNATKITKHVAAFSMEHGHSFLGEPYLKSVLPEEKDDDAR